MSRCRYCDMAIVGDMFQHINDKHPDVLSGPGPAPDKHCVSMPDGSCESTDPRDMHAAKPRDWGLFDSMTPAQVADAKAAESDSGEREPTHNRQGIPFADPSTYSLEMIDEMLKAPDLPGMPPLPTPLPANSYNIQALRKGIREAARLLNICDMEFAKGSRVKAALLFGAAYAKMRQAVEVIAHGYEE